MGSGTEALWQKPPFAGVVEGGMVWGRGTLDDKSNVITQLEAVEMLLAAGFQPRRTVYLAYGHDEEVGGNAGAAQIVALLQQRSVRLEFVVDEGLAVTEGVLAGVQAPLALVGLAEKGYASLKLTAKAPPGHSSMPPTVPGASAIGMLSAALTRLDHAPLPGAIGGVAAEMFAAVAPVAGTLLTDCTRAVPTSLLQIHGTADDRVPFDGGPGKAKTIAGAPNVDGPPVSAVNAAWRGIDGCGEPATSMAGAVTTQTADCPGGRTVELISIAGAGHQWPGGVPSPVAQRLGDLPPPSTALNATDTIWRFFSGHAK